jgi:hypothetical protein
MGSMSHLYAVVPVVDRVASLEWFAAFFGRSADEEVGGEALWQISDTAWIVVDQNDERAGHALLTLGVTGLDEILARLAAHGIDHDRWRPTGTVYGTWSFSIRMATACRSPKHPLRFGRRQRADAVFGPYARHRIRLIARAH